MQTPTSAMLLDGAIAAASVASREALMQEVQVAADDLLKGVPTRLRWQADVCTSVMQSVMWLQTGCTSQLHIICSTDADHCNSGRAADAGRAGCTSCARFNLLFNLSWHMRKA